MTGQVEDYSVGFAFVANTQRIEHASVQSVYECLHIYTKESEHMRISVWLRVYACMCDYCACDWPHSHADVFACACPDLYVCIYVYVCACADVYARTYVYACAYMCVKVMCMLEGAYVYICMYVYV